MLRGMVLGAAMSLCCLDMAFASTPKVDFVFRPSEKDNIYEMRGLVPVIHHKNALLFTDLRGITNLDNVHEVNIGLGGRASFNNMIAGAYYFYDQRQQDGVTYKQNTMGAEILSEWFEARTNLYVPFAEEKGATNTLSYNGAQPIINSITKNQALKGQDGEIGFKVPISQSELWLYGGMYKFTANDLEFKGTKVRAEFNLAPNIMPAGLSTNIGVEYDYNDNEDDRQVVGTLRVGYAFGTKHKKLSHHDHRMLKPIVRDVHIRVGGEKLTTENATLKFTKPDNTVIEFNEGNTVTTGQELLSAVNDNRTTEGKLILLENDVALLRELNFLADDMVIGNNKFEAVGVESGTTVVVDNTTKEKPAIASNAALDDSKLDNIGLIKPQIFYNGVEYDTLEFIKDQATFLAVTQGEKRIFVLDNDIDLATNRFSIRNGVVIGKGEVTLKYNNKESIEKFTETRTVTSRTAEDMFRFISDQNFKLEGVDVELNGGNYGRMLFAYASPDNTARVNSEFKNVNMKISIPTLDYINYITAFHSAFKFENSGLTVNRSPNNGVTFANISSNTNIDLHNQYIKVEDGSGALFRNRGVTDITGNFVVDLVDSIVWDANNFVNGEASVFKLPAGTKITVQPNGVVKDEYIVTHDVTIGEPGVLSPLYNKPVNAFDLSTLSPNIEKVVK